MKILFISLLIIIGWLSLKLLFRIIALLALIKNSGLKEFIKILLTKQTSHSTSNKEEQAKMVKCNTCQLYIPENQAYYYQDKFYCCKEHAKSSKEAL